MTTSTIFFLEERGGKEIKMSSNYAFVASLSTTSPPGNNFVGLVVVPKNQASSSLASVAAVVLSSVVCQEKSKNQPTLWFFGKQQHIFLQHWHTKILHQPAYWFAIFLRRKKSEMIWNIANKAK